jgi:CTP synthase (UTP-ammonia lyase)
MLEVKQIINIGILGDFDPQKQSHLATSSAIRHAAKHLSVEAKTTWIPTSSLLNENVYKELENYDCLWASPGFPVSTDGMIKGIQIARELDKPFLGN